uniref:Programmed cell death 5 n=1 Tax=Sciurus vulgaris TaxID=55149 RepID=A0A8D2DIV7_SCIVU
MADEELETLRKQRLAELQAKHGDPGDAAQQEAKHSSTEGK